MLMESESLVHVCMHLQRTAEFAARNMFVARASDPYAYREQATLEQRPAADSTDQFHATTMHGPSHPTETRQHATGAHRSLQAEFDGVATSKDYVSSPSTCAAAEAMSGTTHPSSAMCEQGAAAAECESTQPSSATSDGCMSVFSEQSSEYSSEPSETCAPHLSQPLGQSQSRVLPLLDCEGESDDEPECDLECAQERAELAVAYLHMYLCKHAHV